MLAMNNHKYIPFVISIFGDFNCDQGNYKVAGK